MVLAGCMRAIYDEGSRRAARQIRRVPILSKMKYDGSMSTGTKVME